MITSYYVTGNTGAGFVNYTQSNIKELQHIFVLKHDSNKIKTSIIQGVANHYCKEENVDVWLSALGKKYLDGVVVRNLSFAVLDERIVPEAIKGKVIELETHFPTREDKTPCDQETIIRLAEYAYNDFKSGLQVHDNLEAIYVNQMDFSRADVLIKQLTQRILQHAPVRNEKGQTYKRLFGTNTPEGAVNCVPELIDQFSDVTYIKGRAGTGKSTLMKQVAEACLNAGFDVEQYHCSFDPNGLDMIIVRDLDVCVFDSTAPHEFEPNPDRDHVIDLYEEAVNTDTDIVYKDAITAYTIRYKAYMKKGIDKLKQAGIYRDKFEKQYDSPTFSGIQSIIETYIETNASGNI